jgi:hypothetical protein
MFPDRRSLGLVSDRHRFTWAQAGASLSGTVTTASGEAIPGAGVSAKNLNTGQTSETKADSAGHFDFSAPPPASFEITISADGYSPRVVQVTFAPGTVQSMTLSMTAIPGWAPPPSLPNAPHPDRTRLRFRNSDFPPNRRKATRGCRRFLTSARGCSRFTRNWV